MLVPARGKIFKFFGALFSSSLFPNRAPDGEILVTAFIGGFRDPQLPSLPLRCCPNWRTSPSAILRRSSAFAGVRPFYHARRVLSRHPTIQNVGFARFFLKIL